VTLWDIAGGTRIGELTIAGARDMCLVHSGPRARLITCSEDGVVGSYEVNIRNT
jgi:hypothetical protein